MKRAITSTAIIAALLDVERIGSNKRIKTELDYESSESSATISDTQQIQNEIIKTELNFESSESSATISDTQLIENEIIKTELDFESSESSATISDTQQIQNEIIKTELDFESSETSATILDTQLIESEPIKTELDFESSEVDYEAFWSQLKVIASNVDPERREIYAIMFVLSQDADKFTYFDGDYGSDSVHTAIKATIKLLRSNGGVDSRFSNFLWMKRDEMIRKCGFIYLPATKGKTSEWNAILNVADKFLADYAFDATNINDRTEIKAKKHEFAIILSTDPNIIRNQINCLEVGVAKVEMAVALCTHILDGVKRVSYKEFRHSRNKSIRKFWNCYLKFPRSENTFQRVRWIVKKYWEFETDDDQIDAVTILVMMDIKLLQLKYLLFDKTISNDLFDKFVSEIGTLKIYRPQLTETSSLSNRWSGTPIGEEIVNISMPIVAHVKRNKYVRRYSTKIMNHVRLKLLGRTDLLVFGYQDEHFICGNWQTVEWLRDTVNVYSSDVSIDKCTQLAGNDFRQIIMLSPRRVNQSFKVYMDLIKVIYPNLRTNLWTRLPSIRGSDREYKWNIKADVESIAYLERYKRRLDVGKLIVKFDIEYVERKLKKKY